jgi:hypothetical protein
MSSSWWLRAIGFCATISPLCASFSSMYTSSLLYTSMWTWAGCFQGVGVGASGFQQSVAPLVKR